MDGRGGLSRRCVVLKVFFLLVAVALEIGCASSGPPLPPSLELPSPVKDLRAVRKGNRVSLAWTLPTQTTDHGTIRHYGPTRICRSTASSMTVCGTPVAVVAPAARVPAAKSPKNAGAQKVSGAFTDTLAGSPDLRPEDEATYAIEVLNQYGRSAGLSGQVHVPVYPALPPPAGLHADVTAEGVKITWSCPDTLAPLANVQYRLRVYRSLDGGPNGAPIAESDLQNCSASLLDSTFEWEKSYQYHADAVIVVSPPGKPQIEIEGDDTPNLPVVAHDVFPPAVPSDLQAAFAGVGQAPFIDLVWSPDTDPDLAGYNVYRHEVGGQPMKVNGTLIAAPAYRDSAVQPGKKYFYAVSAVDARGNESAKSAEASETVP
jgi:hypothetical protein